jgi:integrase
MADYRLDKVTARAVLAKRNEPYWSPHGDGKHLGFRKGNVETWQARWRHPRTGERFFKSLGNVVGMDHNAALKAAQVWWEQCEGGTPKATTVEGACKDYVTNHCAEKSERCAYYHRKMFEKTIYGTAFGRTPLDELHPGEVDKWKNGLVVPGYRERGSANRIFTAFKAAMNFAYRRGGAPSDRPWRVVKRFTAPNKKRERILSRDERKALIGAATPCVANFLTALYYTAARPPEIAQAKVKDLDLTSKTLRLVTRKGPGAERVRQFPLDVNPNALEFFKALAKGKLPAAPLVSWEDGGHLAFQHWGRGIVAARAAASLGADVVAYSMRHTAISEWLSSGVDIGTVAKFSGTSVAMIDAYYHKAIPNALTNRLAHLAAV